MTPRRVLVVDDEVDFLTTYERLLRREGLAVIAASSVAGALEAIERDLLDLIISDLKLPDGDGLAVVRAAQRHKRPLPVIVVTGFPSDETRRTALAEGASAFFPKPFAAAALLAAVRSSLAQS
jgi:DNA-binding NtrC family response regulator